MRWPGSRCADEPPPEGVVVPPPVGVVPASVPPPVGVVVPPPVVVLPDPVLDPAVVLKVPRRRVYGLIARSLVTVWASPVLRRDARRHREQVAA